MKSLMKLDVVLGNVLVGKRFVVGATNVKEIIS
jgi:hypothetical protein